MTRPQEFIIQLLEDCGGWVCFDAISRRGGSAASARALESIGIVESREVIGANGFPFAEWRLVKVLDKR